MANLFELVRAQVRADQRNHRQDMTQGVVIGAAGSQYKVSAGGFTFFCQCGLGDPLKPGDRVWIIAGRGTARIVGLMGKDEAAA